MVKLIRAGVCFTGTLGRTVKVEEVYAEFDQLTESWRTLVIYSYTVGEYEGRNTQLLQTLLSVLTQIKAELDTPDFDLTPATDHIE